LHDLKEVRWPVTSIPIKMLVLWSNWGLWPIAKGEQRPSNIHEYDLGRGSSRLKLKFIWLNPLSTVWLQPNENPWARTTQVYQTLLVLPIETMWYNICLMF
jgi:hypothetical protein